MKIRDIFNAVKVAYQAIVLPKPRLNFPSKSNNSPFYTTHNRLLKTCASNQPLSIFDINRS